MFFGHLPEFFKFLYCFVPWPIMSRLFSFTKWFVQQRASIYPLCLRRAAPWAVCTVEQMHLLLQSKVSCPMVERSLLHLNFASVGGFDFPIPFKEREVKQSKLQKLTRNPSEVGDYWLGTEKEESSASFVLHKFNTKKTFFYSI